MQSIESLTDTSSPYNATLSEAESDVLWLDTVMYAKGHAFGYSGDVSEWDGWYFDTIKVGDDRMLSCDSIGPSILRLDLVTRQTTVDLGSPNAAGQIRRFLNPIAGFKRFHKKYELCIDSVFDEEYGMMRCWGEISYLADYADTCRPDADNINRFMISLVCNHNGSKMEAPALTSLYIGYKPSRQPAWKYDGIAKDIVALSDFIKNQIVKGWKEEDDLPYIGSTASNLDVRVHIANSKFVTFSVYDYSRIGTGHGGYTETFHTFDMKQGKELSNADMFKPETLDKVKLLLYDVMATDPKYIAWHRGIKSASDVQALFESPELVGQKKGSEFTLPEGALTNSGVVFSFQPYEIDCWAAGAYHFIIPYKRLEPYLSARTKHSIRGLNS